MSFENQSLKLDSAQEALAVAELIKAHQDMKTLTLSGNTIGINAAEVIGNSLKTHPEFKRAHWKDMFTGRSKTEIPPALKHLVIIERFGNHTDSFQFMFTITNSEFYFFISSQLYF